ncbi:MAG: hypothetical protein J6I66_04505 [Lachnospiraceae bacterium]|nr:hypothetical protein [Lachnospiraceae bacterium]
MIGIKEKQELHIDNLICYRGIKRQDEIGLVVQEMETYIREVGARRIGDLITATHSIEGNGVDFEVFMPIDRRVDSSDTFAYKRQILIVNAVVASFKGYPAGFQEVYNQLNKYIAEHELKPITTGYVVSKSTDKASSESVEIDIYVGINPNIV